MPSSHSAAVTALTTAVALEFGLGSTIFAVCAIFGIIVMFDATGVRRHAGYHATVLNQLVADFNKLVGFHQQPRDSPFARFRCRVERRIGHCPLLSLWLVLIVLAALLAGTAVSVAGLIGFVGLVVPHAIRIFIGEDYRFLLPLSAV